MSPASAQRQPAERYAGLSLSAQSLCVSRGGRPVLEDVSFTVAAGEALVVTGRNGVGKSTLLRALAGLLPWAGEIKLTGGASDMGDMELVQQAHYLAHADGLKASLSVTENLTFWAHYLGADDARSRPVEAALAVVGLGHAREAPVAVLSAGQKRRVALARLLVAFRPVWLLDEPLTALDRASREKIAAALRAHCAMGGLIVAATHEPLGLEEARELPLGASAESPAT